MALGGPAVRAVIVTSIFTFFGTFFVVLRLWTRFVITRAPGWEDVILFVSWLCAIATTVATGMQLHFGLGQHGEDLEGYQIEGLLLSLYIAISVYCASIGLTKLAILMQYQRVFTTPRFQAWCWSIIAIIVAYTLATVFAGLFVCTPPRKFWVHTTEGKCLNSQASWFSNAAINIVTDLMIIILPMPVVKRLRLPRKQKWLLMGVFAFGAVVCVISIVRLQALLVITETTEPTFDNAPVASFSIVELNVALVSACLPTLRPLLSKWITGIGYSSGAHGISGINNLSSGRRSNILPSLGSHSMQLNGLGTRKGIEKLEGEEDEEDKIRVVTRVDVKVSDKDLNQSIRDERESSTESLFRSARGNGHVV